MKELAIMQITPLNISVKDVISQPPALSQELAKNDFVRITSSDFLDEIGSPDNSDIETFKASWNSLAEDEYMADGGRYRHRRHSVFSAGKSGGNVQREPHQPHYQTTKFNTLNGGVERYFQPIEKSISENKVFKGIMNFATKIFGAVSPLNDWHIEVHQFRILAQESGGKPTPEGVHQDGVDFVLMVFIDRQNIIEGETTVEDLDGNVLTRFTLKNSMEAVMVNDLRVAHGVTPILPQNPDEKGLRDMLVVTFKRKS